MKKNKLKPGLHIVGFQAAFLCIFLLVAYAFVGFSIGRHIYEKPPSLEDQFMEQTLEYFNDSATDEAVYNCTNLSSAQEQALCVNLFIRNSFKFNNDGHEGIKTPQDTLNSGGVCRDWSVTYAIILLKLNWTVEFVTPPNHVFVTASKDDMYCNFDQSEITCFTYSQNQKDNLLTLPQVLLTPSE